METLHPVAQVVGIIVLGIVATVVILSTTDFFDNLNRKK
jgi:hypothetical protein